MVFKLKETTYIFSLLFILLNCDNNRNFDLPIEDYKKEIQALSKEDYYDYWEKLNNFDQKVVLEAKNFKAYDSLSIVSLIKSALFYELKGDSIFKAPNTYNEFFFIHNHTPKSNLDFWPLLLKQKKVRGRVLMFPSYQLEGIAGSFYDYSVFGQDSIYDELLSKIKPLSNKKISDALIDTYTETKRINQLSIEEKIGTWQRKRIKNEPFDPKAGNFELLILSDKNYYLRYNNGGFKPIEIIDKNDKTFTFKTKYEPFGWYFTLKNDSNLSLHDEKDILLISYSKA